MVLINKNSSLHYQKLLQEILTLVNLFLLFEGQHQFLHILIRVLMRECLPVVSTLKSICLGLPVESKVKN